MSFLLGEKDLAGTNAERRIQEVLAMGSGATQTYSLKETTRVGGSNAFRYTPEQKKWLSNCLREPLKFFGYSILP